MAHIFGTGDPGEAVLADKRPEEPSALRVAEAPLGMAFVGTYPPRRCGIATFTRDLVPGGCRPPASASRR